MSTDKQDVGATPTRRRRAVSRGPIKLMQGRPSQVFELLDAGGRVFKFPPNGAWPTFINRGGPVLSHPFIKPIFVGPEWGLQNPPISPAEILDAIDNIIEGPYLSGLSQYGIDAAPIRQDPMYALDAIFIPTAPTADELQEHAEVLLYTLINIDRLPEPDDDRYADSGEINVLFYPSTTAYPPGIRGVISGFHSTFDWWDWNPFDIELDPVLYMVVCTQRLGATSPLDMTSSTFSHELVEIMTDPGPSKAWRQDPDPDSTAGEIGDVCGQLGRLDGTAVQAYWSASDQTCIIPTRNYSVTLAGPFITETPTTNGPDRHEVVDEQCGRSHHWKGEYTYHIVNHRQTATINATVTGYVDPYWHWTVAGIDVRRTGSPVTIKLVLPTWSPALFGSHEAPRTVTLTVVATESTVQISNDPNDGNYIVPVSYFVRELNDYQDTEISAVRRSLDVDITGHTVWAPPEFTAAQAACIQEQTADILRTTRSLHDLVAEFNELLRTHKGPPIDQDLIRDVRQLSRDLVSQLATKGPPGDRSDVPV